MTAPAPNWIIMPVVNRWDLTEAAITDCLAQTVTPAPQVLVIASSPAPDLRDGLERWMEREPRLHVWCHTPPLLSLSAIWNRALRFVWTQGGEHALVVNNDVRLHAETYRTLQLMQYETQALFVSAVGRREADMDWAEYFRETIPYATFPTTRGGPDFSCFLVRIEGHLKYPFDERFIPAYCEDLDCHRRYLLGGDGHRIFSINLPYLHYGSATVNADPAERANWARRIDHSRAYYRSKWGGDVNQERWTIPFDAETDQAGVTTPELQARYREAAQQQQSVPTIAPVEIADASVTPTA